MIKSLLSILVLLSSVQAFAASKTELELVSCTVVANQAVLTFRHMTKYINLFMKKGGDTKAGTVLLENDNREGRALMPASFSSLESGELKIIFKESDENAFTLLIGKDENNDLKGSLTYPASKEILKYDCKLRRN